MYVSLKVIRNGSVHFTTKELLVRSENLLITFNVLHLTLKLIYKRK